MVLSREIRVLTHFFLSRNSYYSIAFTYSVCVPAAVYRSFYSFMYCVHVGRNRDLCVYTHCQCTRVYVSPRARTHRCMLMRASCVGRERDLLYPPTYLLKRLVLEICCLTLRKWRSRTGNSVYNRLPMRGVDSSRGNNRPPENTQCVIYAFAETRSRPSHVLALIPTTRWAFDWSDPRFYPISRADVVKVVESYANISKRSSTLEKVLLPDLHEVYFFLGESSTKL